MAPPTLDALDAFLAGCSLLENVEEVPAGSNAGPIVEPIQASTGNRRGDPWCASAKAYVGSRVLGKRWPLPLTASCNALAIFAAKHAILRTTAVVYADLAANGLRDAAGALVIAATDVGSTIGAAADIVAAPARGDVCLLYSTRLHHFHHAGAVREVLATRFRTWEGNTTKAGQAGNEREGWGYFPKEHALADPWGFVRWIDLLELLERVPH